MAEIIGSSLSTLESNVRKLLPGLSSTGSNSSTAVRYALNKIIERVATLYLCPFLRVRSELEFVESKASVPSDYYSYSSLKDENDRKWRMVDPETFDTAVGDVFTREFDSNLSRTISTAVLTSNVVTVTTSAAHGFVEGDIVNQTGVGSATFNAEDIEILSAPSTTTYTYAKVSANESSSAGTVTRQRTDRFFINGVTEDTLLLRYYRLPTAMSDDADLSGLPTYVEEAVVNGVMAFLSKRNNAKNEKLFWESEFRMIFDPIFNRVTDDEQEDDEFLTVYDEPPISAPISI